MISGEIVLDGRPLSTPGWFVRRRLKKAQRLFEASLQINQVGWNSMFMIGKIEQRLGNNKDSLEWFLRAREFAPENTSLAKETSAMASQLGMHEMAARVADEALVLKSDDGALVVNSGLAHILCGNLEIALDRFREAARLEPHHSMNQKLAEYTSKVLAGSIPLPKIEADIIHGIKTA